MVSNAAAHVRRDVVVNSDLKDFFPSITVGRVRGVFEAIGYSPAVATVLALHHRVSPPTINLDDLDPQVELDIATKARDLPMGDIAALNNSFGFGGANVAVAFGSV